MIIIGPNSEAALGKEAAELSKLIEQPEIVAPYKSAASRIGLVVFISLLPAWGIWAVYVACWLLRGVIQGGLSDYLDLFLLSLLFLTLPVIGITGVHSCLDNKIRFSSVGITFPFRFVLQLGGNLRRGWHMLQQIDFTNSLAPSSKPDFITFHFKDSEPLRLELGGLEERDLRELIMTLDVYAPDVTYVPPRASVELSMPSLTGTKSTSFTQLWESELSSRFTSTAFVPLEPGSILQAGSIVVVGQIAFGGLSAIYLARRKDGTRVVLKEAIVPANANEETCKKALSMFDREAHFLMGLKHARIARVFDHFIEKGRHYLLLEHIDGTDLRRVVRDSGPQPESFVIRWGAEVADILEYLHSQSPPIVHRDVTPDNLVLANDGHITLIDFGAANEFVGTATGTLIGKQSYISPEQFRGKAQTASDLYSLGCTIFFLLTGEDPEPLSESSPRLKNSAVSIQLDNIVVSCTTEETELRVRDAKLLAQSLRQLINSDARLGANE